MKLLTRYSHLSDEKLMEAWKDLYQGLVVSVAFGKDSGESSYELDELEQEILMRMGCFSHLQGFNSHRLINALYRDIDKLRLQREELVRAGKDGEVEELEEILERLHKRPSLLLDYDMITLLRNARKEDRRRKENRDDSGGKIEESS